MTSGNRKNSNPPQTFICLGCKKAFQKIWFPGRKRPKYCNTSCRKFHRITMTCKTCGKIFELPPSRKTRMYCSKECSHEGQKRTKKICKWCGIAFHPTSNQNIGFCSLQCSADSKKDTRLEKSCEICGKIFQVKKGYTHARFCSLQCSAKGIAKKGADNPMWRGGHITYRGPNWSMQAKQARKRDNYTCQMCKHQQKTPSLCVHHIIPCRKFNGDYETANDLSNLITLCQRCHAIVETSISRLRNDIGQFIPITEQETYPA
jgi:5-methylcytosine-specific restriction endonuclease McrA